MYIRLTGATLSATDKMHVVHTICFHAQDACGAGQTHNGYVRYTVAHLQEGIEFVKVYRAHLGSVDGELITCAICAQQYALPFFKIKLRRGFPCKLDCMMPLHPLYRPPSYIYRIIYLCSLSTAFIFYYFLYALATPLQASQ